MITLKKKLEFAAGFLILAAVVLALTVTGRADTLIRGQFPAQFRYDNMEFYSYGNKKAVFVGISPDFVGETVIIPETVEDEAGKTRTVVGIVHTNVQDGRMIDIQAPSTLEFIANEVNPEDENDGDLRYCDPAISSNVRSLDLSNVPDLTIEEGSIWYCDALSAISFNPDGDLNVQMYAIGECRNLTKLSFPEDAEVDGEALSRCYSLKTIVNAPGDLDFEIPGESALISITYAPGTQEITGFTSYLCQDGKSIVTVVPHLKNVTIPDGVVSVGGFGRCRDLKEITLPEGLTEIGCDAFCECTSLTSINLPDSIEVIEEGAFCGCTSLSGISGLPSSIEEVGSEAFAGCTNLKMSVDHPGEEYLDQYRNSGIVSLTLNDCTVIDVEGLCGCPNLERITLKGSSGNYKIVDGLLYQKITGNDGGWMLAKYPAGISTTGSCTIPNDVTNVGPYAFDSCIFSEIHLPVTLRDVFLIPDVQDEPEEWYPPFSNMASNPTIFYICNSYMDGNEHLKQCNTKGEYGSDVKITYTMDGGKKNSSSPTTFKAGNSIEMITPKKQYYVFLNWQAYDNDSGEWVKVTGKTYTPSRGQLVSGLKLKATWKKKTLKENTKEMVKGCTYKVTKVASSEKNGDVILIKGKNAKTVTVPASVTLSDGNTYLVRGLGKMCFKNSSAKTVIIKSTYIISYSSVSQSLKNSLVKTVKIPKKCTKAYKKYFSGKNVGKKVTLKTI